MKNFEKVKKAIDHKTQKSHRVSYAIVGVLIVLLIIGYASGFIVFNSVEKGPNYSKSDQCFEQLKAKHSPQEMMQLIAKKKMSESYCDLL